MSAKRQTPPFHRELQDCLGVGSVDEESARLWLRVVHTGAYRIALEDEATEREPSLSEPLHLEGAQEAGTARDGTTSLLYPDEVAGATPLQADRRYRVQLRDAQGRVMGESVFHTAPSEDQPAPARFSIAVMSCHQPFDEAGELDAEAEALLKRAPEILARHDVRRVVLLGDQMYADMPEGLSLFGEHFAQVAPPGRESLLECDSQEVRALYQQRYRAYWRSPGFQRIQSRYPCVAILDDHELVDNFGSDPAHGGPRWKDFRTGALQAAFDYQGSRTHAPTDTPGPMDFGFRYGPFACYVLDLRSERVTYDDSLQVYGEAQHRRLEAFLEAHADAEVLALGLSVPLVHIPDWTAKLGIPLTGEGTDLADRWANPKARHARERLLRTLADHQHQAPRQKLLLLGGDVHVGMLTALRWPALELEASQLVSSAVSNSQKGLERVGAKLASLLGTVRDVTPEDDGVTRCEVELTGCDDPNADNPYGGLNIGIVQMERREGAWHTELKLLGVDDGGEPRTLVSARLS